MFDPMFSNPILEAVPFVVGFIGFAIGLYWIHRITKDIEDN